MKTVYLAGPMGIYEDDKKNWQLEVIKWREQATAVLKDHGHKAFSPADRPYTGANYVEIVEADLEEVRKSDAVLAYAPHVRMIGTPMEIFFASHVLRTPVFTFPKYNHPWLRYYTQQNDTLSDALEALLDELGRF